MIELELLNKMIEDFKKSISEGFTPRLQSEFGGISDQMGCSNCYGGCSGTCSATCEDSCNGTLM